MRIRAKLAFSVIAVVALALASVPPALSGPQAGTDMRKVPCPGPVHVGGCQLWEVRHDSGTHAYWDEARDVAAGPDGELVFATGRTDHASGSTYADYRAATVAFETDTGDIRWNDTREDASRGTGIEVGPDGSQVFVATYGWTDVVAYDAQSGDVLWTIEGIPGPDDMGVSPSGDTLYLLGPEPDEATGQDIGIRAYDAQTGYLSWTSSWDGGGGDDRPGGGGDLLAVHPDGTQVFAVGRTPQGASGLDVATVAWDTTTEEVAWASVTDGPQGERDVAKGLAFSPASDQVVVTAETWISGSGGSPARDTGVLTVALDASDGTEQWTSVHDESGDIEQPAGVGVDPGGQRAFVAGWMDGCLLCADAGGTDYLTLGLNLTTGETEWTTRYDGPFLRDYGEDLSVGPDGEQVYVAGTSAGATLVWDLVTVAYEADDGDQAWAARYPGATVPLTYGGQAHGLDVGPDGDAVYTAGESIPPEITRGKDFTVVAYATGLDVDA